MVWFGVVKDHSKPVKIAPFDRAHMTFIVIMSLSCSVSRI